MSDLTEGLQQVFGLAAPETFVYLVIHHGEGTDVTVWATEALARDFVAWILSLQTDCQIDEDGGHDGILASWSIDLGEQVLFLERHAVRTHLQPKAGLWP